MPVPPGGRPGPAVGFTAAHDEFRPQLNRRAVTFSGSCVRRTWATSWIVALLVLPLTLETARAGCYGALNTAAAIQQAMKNAAPGTTILVAPGTYVGVRSTSGNSKAHFYTNRNGTAAKPIILRSCEPSRPAVFAGDGASDGSYVLHLTGDYWIVEDIVVTAGTKGVIVDNGSHNVLRRMEVHTIGDEGIHLRDGSSYTMVEDCFVHDTGVVRPEYGEGVYVGSDDAASYDHTSIANVIRGCRFVRVTAEHLDVKEGTTGTLIENCTFDGTGLSGLHSADSFVDLKGAYAICRNNVGYRRGNANILDAFQVRVMSGQPYITGLDNVLYGNTIDLDNGSGVVVRNVSPATGTVCYSNVRVGGGKLYAGTITTSQPVGVGDERPAPETLSLAGFLPNPTRVEGMKGIAFVLASSEAAQVEVFDVSGRRMFAEEVGSLGPGRHVLGGDKLPRFAPGVYMLSLCQAGQRRTLRGVIVE